MRRLTKLDSPRKKLVVFVHCRPSKIIRLASCFLFLSAALQVNALPIYEASFSPSVGTYANSSFGPIVIGGQLDSNPGQLVTTDNGDTASASGAGTIEVFGADENGENSTMSLSYEGRSSASLDGLKAEAFAELTNPFYNPSNPPVFQFDPFQFDQSGVPDYFLVASSAVLETQLTISGPSDLASITIELSVDGETSGAGGVSVGQRIGADTIGSLLFERGDFSIDTTITTNPIALDANTADLYLRLQADVLFDLTSTDLTGIDLLSGGSAFFNTVEIGRVAGFDSNGNPVSVLSATDPTGAALETVSVDIPATLGLLVTGFTLLRLRRERTH